MYFATVLDSEPIIVTNCVQGPTQTEQQQSTAAAADCIDSMLFATQFTLELFNK